MECECMERNMYALYGIANFTMCMGQAGLYLFIWLWPLVLTVLCLSPLSFFQEPQFLHPLRFL